MRIIPLLFFSCCYIPAAFGQELRGIVSDTESGELLGGARVENKGRQGFAVTDSHGAFTLYALPGDTLRISLVGYLERSMVVQGTERTTFRRIALSRELVRIDTVVVTPGLTPYQRDSLERRAVYRKALDKKPDKFKFVKIDTMHTVRGVELKAVFDAPLTSLLQKRSRKYKRLKSFQNHFKLDENQRYIDSRYNKETVGELTGLSGEALSTFIAAHPMAYDFARAATDMEIKMWIRYNYRLWSARQAEKKK